MPRTQKYDVNESIASSQATIIPRVNDNNIHEHENHIGAPVPRRKNSISVGWLLGIAFGALCLAFLLCVAFLKIPGVPTERTPFSERQILRKQGYFQIYPTPSIDKLSRRTQVILLSDTRSIIEQLAKQVNGYPKFTNSYTSCYVSVPTFSHPCFFEKEWLGTSCTEENSFGYKEVDGMINPCILLKLENLTDWAPLVYRSVDVDESWKNSYDPTFSSLGCTINNRHNEDKPESIQIYPPKGFSNQFFPVSSFNKSLYLQPSVMLQINNLTIGQSITFQCWLRVSNAYMLEDNGEIIVRIGSANTTSSSNPPSTTSSYTNSSTASSTVEPLTKSTILQNTETIAGETTTVRQFELSVN